MKKAIVLGIMAFFAINLITVQNVNAQDKKDPKPAKTELKTEKSPVKAEAAQLQKDDEKAPKTAIKECDKKECDKKGKEGCCKEGKEGKEVKPAETDDNNLRMKPKEIKVEKGKPGTPKKAVGKKK